jgi:hypothetical protein
MKIAVSVSLAALALASCATNPQLASEQPFAPPPQINSGPARTAEGRANS